VCHRNIVEFVRGEIKKAESLLGGKKVDVFSYARIPPGVEPEELFTALKQCRDEGLFAAVGASETGVETLEKAQKVRSDAPAHRIPRSR
jgi:pyridoxine 4-dehydrogenase